MPLILNLSVSRDSGSLILNLAPTGDNRTAVIAGRGRVTGAAQLGLLIDSTITGVTSRCRGGCVAAYDPNLLSAFHSISGSDWNDGDSIPASAPTAWQPAQSLILDRLESWRVAQSVLSTVQTIWKPAIQFAGSGVTTWNAGELLSGSQSTAWQDSIRLASGVITVWNESDRLNQSAVSEYRPRLPLLAPDYSIVWNDGLVLSQTLDSPANDGTRLESRFETLWNEAGLAYNAWKPPVIPPEKPKPPQKPLILNLRRYRQPGALVLNLQKDSDRTDWEVAIQRVYAVYNECYLVRLPDRTPLPVTSMTISTDANSWCWSLTANLGGPEGWALVEPQSPGFMPIEVEAMINGHVWQFLLDLPNHSRQFNNNKTALSGRSRTAWLDQPYDLLTSSYVNQPRTMNQIGEEILDGTGYSLVWEVDDWLVPSKTFIWQNMDRMSRIKKIANSIRACVYSDPKLPILTIYPRYRVQSWMLDSNPVDVTVPASALLDWSKQSDRKPYYNGVYVSGTENGVLAWVKISGTDGMQIPDQPIVESLCCDSEGIAARQRGIVELSESAMGYQIQVKTILTNNGIGGPSLITPMQLVKFNDIKGFVRSVSVNASLSGGWNGVLGVKQTIELERREHE